MKREMYVILPKNNAFNDMNLDLENKQRVISPYISVDCVLIGFDGKQLKTLLVSQIGVETKNGESEFKLPGSLIYEDEDLDDAAKRVLTELTGLKSVPMRQFHAFGSVERTRDPKDTRWLERFHSLDCKINRIVTVGYLALLKIDRKYGTLSDRYEAKWVPLKDIGKLAFDHNEIVALALDYIKNLATTEPDIIFSLLPRKFTALKMRSMFELVYDRKFDVRNFHKKIAKMDYVVALDEKEADVAHRAARFYRFDRVIYNKSRN